MGVRQEVGVEEVQAGLERWLTHFLQKRLILRALDWPSAPDGCLGRRAERLFYCLSNYGAGTRSALLITVAKPSMVAI